MRPWTPRLWPVIAIHAALLPTGEVLHYSYPSDGAGSHAMTWNPVTNAFADVSMSTDIFCSGYSYLADGTLYVTGGNDLACDFQGRDVTFAFQPFDATWSRLDDMSVARWYPTNVTLGDGRVLIFAGLDRSCDPTPVVEIYTPGSGLAVIPQAQRYMALYPRMHLLPDGRVAHTGPQPGTFTFDPGSGTWTHVDDMARFRWDGTSFLVPGSPTEVVTCGGSDADVTATCERIDFADPAPLWRATGSMSQARSHANAVILPDRRVLIVGGGTGHLYGGPVLNAEIYDPDAETWTLLPPQVHPRMYHSTALLLPDGRVLTAGHDDGESFLWGEVYEPSYLFRGARPRISSVPGEISYGTTITITTPEAGGIASVALISLSTVTHSVNNSQRYVGLGFTAAGADRLRATAPSHPDAAVPGYYMLFLVDGQGVPSVAEIVRLVDDDGLFRDGFESGDTSAWSSGSGF